MQDWIKKYARVLISQGASLQHHQTLLINAEIEHADFVRTLTQEAYTLGAKEVIVNWKDGIVLREKLLHAPESVLTHPKSWIKEYYSNMLADEVAVIALVSANPKLLEGVSSKRVAMHSKHLSLLTKFYHEAIMSSEITWCVAAVPTLLWANLLGLTGTNEEKINTLWDIILTLSRIKNVSKEEEFQNHIERLYIRTKRLNELHLRKLQYTAPNGTNITIGLPKNHIWLGGSEKSQKGIVFNANIPTEEVFTAPHKLELDGIVHSTKPLIYHGTTIDGFSLTFEKGRITHITAEKGLSTLEELVATDEGSHYIGEIALVDHYSPISQSNRIYYETLFDENASCHLAIGAAYPINLKEGSTFNDKELEENGLNTSLTHVDFMIGHPLMQILGICENGEEIQIMEEGRLLI